MPVSFRDSPTVLAALAAAVLAAFTLTDPPGGTWAVYTSERELDRWLSAQPTGIAVGAVVAVAACVLLQRAGSARAAWGAAAVATVIVWAVRSWVPEVAGIDGLIALHVLKAVAAGVLLGAAVAAAWEHRLARLAVALGAVGGFLSVSAWASVETQRSTSSLGEPAVWLLAATVVLALVAVAAPGPAPQPVTGEQARVALLTVVVVAVANRLLTAWISSGDTEGRTRQWIAIAVSIVVVLVATEVCARLVDTRVGDGAILLAVTGIAAAAMPVLVDLRSPLRDFPAWSAVAVAGVAVAAGLAIAARRPLPLVGLGVAALVPVVGAIWPDFGSDGAWLLARLAVVGVGAGLAIGGTLSSLAAVAAAALVIPFVSTVFHAAATVVMPAAQVIYNGAYEPLEGVEMSREYSNQLDEYLDSFLGIPIYDDRVAGIALALAVVFCAWGVRGLRASR
ncbi:hypothetical protein [Rhodococcus gannanensis]|uniref:Uncharacterized protein n=1 Tax=Rhodococcus gannanensis TaxID=1960308 RepID=A0ABW4PAK7_9NOCA